MPIIVIVREFINDKMRLLGSYLTNAENLS
nr:MAG TPA: hypothetical protein [Inoviridae sp.]